MFKCPECSGNLQWVTDNEDDGHITNEYYCEKCSIELIKHFQTVKSDSTGEKED